MILSYVNLTYHIFLIYQEIYIICILSSSTSTYLSCPSQQESLPNLFYYLYRSWTGSILCKKKCTQVELKKHVWSPNNSNDLFKSKHWSFRRIVPWSSNDWQFECGISKLKPCKLWNINLDLVDWNPSAKRLVLVVFKC